MGWFDRPVTAQTPVQQESAYTLEKVAERLDTFGIVRLSVNDPILKVMITRIAQEGLAYLDVISGGKLKGSHISEMITTLTLLIETMQKYVEIQNNPDRYTSTKPGEDQQSLMRQGFNSVKAYHDKLTASVTGGDLTGYQATADYLSGTIHTI